MHVGVHDHRRLGGLVRVALANQLDLGTVPRKDRKLLATKRVVTMRRELGAKDLGATREQSQLQRLQELDLDAQLVLGLQRPSSCRFRYLFAHCEADRGLYARVHHGGRV